MWTPILVIVGIFIFYVIFLLEKPKGKSTPLKKSKTPSNKIKTKKPDADWIFEREVDQAGVPAIINNYRKVINGYDYKKIARSLKGIAQIENEVQRNLGYLQFLEPLAEFERNGWFEFNKDMPNVFFEQFIFDLFNFFNPYYSAIGAKGQMKNLEDICKYIPELNGWVGAIDFWELDLRNEIIDDIRKDGFIDAKDLTEELENIENYHLGKNLIYRLEQYNIIEMAKEGKKNIYRLKTPQN